jgi:UDP-2,4-diacetamido-2,4,6-trideoxy-beta-L-altropyranose hydrolase
MPPNLNALRILFVSAASNSIGFGHLSRCLALAAYAQKCGANVGFLVFGNVSAEVRVNSAGFGCILLDESKINTANLLRAREVRADVVIVDLLFQGFFATVSPLRLFQRLRGLGRCLVVIDVPGDGSIAHRLPKLFVDIVINPYVTIRGGVPSICRRYLEGAEYALLGAEYVNLPPRRQRRIANRVLISCGGSDPKGYTLEILRGLGGVALPLEIRAVVGPLFSVELRAEIDRLVKTSQQKISQVIAPPTLLNEMLWCDLAIGASGLTKYEFAATGTPTLLFSIDEHHDLVNRPFADRLTSIDLGVGVSVDQVRHEATKVLRSIFLRCAMAKQGKALVDGEGSKRLFNAIKKELSCYKTN